jgi:sugar-specific transcriptional regulator TrmB
VFDLMTAQKQVEGLITEINEILDLDELESRIYLNLLRTGPITASALAKNLDVDRAGMYRTVEKMVGKNVITCTLSSPKLLTPLEPKNILNAVLEKKEEKIKKIKESGKTLVDKINNNITINQGPNIPTLKIIQGRENIYTEIAQIIENCTDTVFIVTTIDDLSQMANSIISEKIKICQSNGGRVFVLVGKNDGQSTSLNKIFRATEIRFCKLPSLGRIAVHKDARMVMSDSIKPSNSTITDYSVSTDAKDMISNIDHLCRVLWRSAKPSKKNKI